MTMRDNFQSEEIQRLRAACGFGDRADLRGAAEPSVFPPFSASCVTASSDISLPRACDVRYLPPLVRRPLLSLLAYLPRRLAPLWASWKAWLITLVVMSLPLNPSVAAASAPKSIAPPSRCHCSYRQRAGCAHRPSVLLVQVRRAPQASKVFPTPLARSSMPFPIRFRAVSVPYPCRFRRGRVVAPCSAARNTRRSSRRSRHHLATRRANSSPTATTISLADQTIHRHLVSRSVSLFQRFLSRVVSETVKR